MWFAALPVTFITPLSDFTIPEGGNVTFKCVTSKPEKVQWFKNGKKITKPDKRIKIKDDGVEHTLTIEKSVLDDGAEYSAKIGNQSTVGKLTVEGIYCMHEIDQTMHTVHVFFFLKIASSRKTFVQHQPFWKCTCENNHVYIYCLYVMSKSICF